MSDTVGTGFLFASISIPTFLHSIIKKLILFSMRTCAEAGPFKSDFHLRHRIVRGFSVNFRP
jgi:hypothetical protein